MPPKKDTKGGSKDKPKPAKGAKATDEGLENEFFFFRFSILCPFLLFNPVGAGSKEKKGGNAVKVRHILCEKQGKIVFSFNFV